LHLPGTTNEEEGQRRAIVVGKGKKKRVKCDEGRWQYNRDRTRHSRSASETWTRHSNSAIEVWVRWERATDHGVDEAGLVIVLILDELDIDDLDINLLLHSRLDLLAKLDRVLVIGQAKWEGNANKSAIVYCHGSLAANGVSKAP
jgi:hypothetical protein